MFVVNEDGSIFLTRGDVAQLKVSAKSSETTQYEFQTGDIVRLTVMQRKQCGQIVLQIDTEVEVPTEEVIIRLEKEDTKFGELINKPVDYWYEIEINPETAPQTIVGYDADGPKIFRLFPEGGTDV